jgi:transposase-like protein
MTEPLDDFESLVDSPEETTLEKRKKRVRSFIAIRDMVVNPDVAARLVKGESIVSVALDLGVSQQTIRRWMQKLDMQDLIAIEARRALRHMSTRDLSREKYLGLATAVTGMLEQENRMRNGDMGTQDRVINQTVIEQINVLVRGRGNERESAKDVQDISELESNEVPELPEGTETE